jgi:hypothetical protein
MRSLAALAGAAVLAAALAAAAAPAGPEGIAAALRSAIAARDYATIEALICWDGAGTIKRRVVAYQVRHGLGRQIKEIAVEPASGAMIAADAARMRQRLNMPVSHKIRVVYDEPLTASGQPPTAVYLVGQTEAGWRIALVVHDAAFKDDD